MVECEVVPFRHSRGRSPNPATMRPRPPESGGRVRRQKPRASTSATPFANRFRAGRTRGVRVRAPARRAARQKAKRIAEYCGEDCSNARTAGGDVLLHGRPRGQQATPEVATGQDRGGRAGRRGLAHKIGRAWHGERRKFGRARVPCFIHLGEKATHCATIRGRSPPARRRRGEPTTRASTSANPFANRFRSGRTREVEAPGRGRRGAKN